MLTLTKIYAVKTGQPRRQMCKIANVPICKFTKNIMGIDIKKDRENPAFFIEESHKLVYAEGYKNNACIYICL